MSFWKRFTEAVESEFVFHMDGIVLDTDVFSLLLRQDSRAELYRPILRGKRIAISFITLGELYYWPLKRNWGARRIAALEEAIAATALLPYDIPLCREYGRAKSSLAKGVNVPSNDLWIAVSAIRHGLPLLTHNRKDFERIPRLNLI